MSGWSLPTRFTSIGPLIMFKKICPLLLLILSINLHAVEFAVSPMLININAQPGGVEDFEIAVSGKESGNVTISIFAMQQMDSGHMSFIEQQAPSGTGVQAVSWISFEKEDYRISRNETTQIRGKVSVPRKAKGSFLAAIMVEEILFESSSNVSVRVRYAVILNIHVEGRKGRVKTAFDDLVVVNRGGLALIEGSFSNSNAFMGFLDSSVQVRDQNRRLIARLPLRTESAWQRGD